MQIFFFLVFVDNKSHIDIDTFPEKQKTEERRKKKRSHNTQNFHIFIDKNRVLIVPITLTYFYSNSYLS